MQNHWLEKERERSIPTIKFENGVIVNVEEILGETDWSKMNGGCSCCCWENRIAWAWLKREDAVVRDKKMFCGYVKLFDSHRCGAPNRRLMIWPSRPESLFDSTIIEENVDGEDFLQKIPLLPGQSASACDKRVRYDPKDADKFPDGQTDLRIDYSTVNMNYGKENNVTT